MSADPFSEIDRHKEEGELSKCCQNTQMGLCNNGYFLKKPAEGELALAHFMASNGIGPSVLECNRPDQSTNPMIMRNLPEENRADEFIEKYNNPYNVLRLLSQHDTYVLQTIRRNHDYSNVNIDDMNEDSYNPNHLLGLHELQTWVIYTVFLRNLIDAILKKARELDKLGYVLLDCKPENFYIRYEGCVQSFVRSILEADNRSVVILLGSAPNKGVFDYNITFIDFNPLHVYKFTDIEDRPDDFQVYVMFMLIAIKDDLLKASQLKLQIVKKVLLGRLKNQKKFDDWIEKMHERSNNKDTVRPLASLIYLYHYSEWGNSRGAGGYSDRELEQLWGHLNKKYIRQEILI